MDQATLTESRSAVRMSEKLSSALAVFHPLVTKLSVQWSSISPQLVPQRSAEHCFRPSFVLTAIQLRNASSQNATSNMISQRELGSYREVLCHLCMISLTLLFPFFFFLQPQRAGFQQCLFTNYAYYPQMEGDHVDTTVKW